MTLTEAREQSLAYVTAFFNTPRSRTVAWILVLLAGVLEIGFALSLKASDGFTKLWPSIGVCVFGGASFLLLTIALKTLAVGTAYAVWTGIGAVGVAILGIVLFNEPRDLLRIASILLIVAGIAGLKLVSP